MQGIDPEIAKNVWQRVQNTPRPPDLQGLLPGELRLSAEYGRLLRKAGANAGALRQLQEECRAAIATVQGICILTGQNCHAKLPPNQKEEPPLTVLRRCYGLNLSAARQYQALAQDAEYGHAFAFLAEQKRRHCAALLQIIGSSEK